jgi:ABC-type branched-subunit amino acid transport system substrate-binding protein
MTHTTSTAAKALLLLAATCFAGCSLQYDFRECATSDDCLRFEAADGVFYQCSAQNTCVADESIGCRADGDCGSNQRCNAQSQCEADFTQPDGGDPDTGDAGTDADDAGDPGCTTNQECIDSAGAGFACGADGACFSLLGENGECERVHYTQPANEVENVVYFGSMLPLVEPFGSVIGRPIENAIQLAVDDFNKAGGLPDGRRIAWVSCDSKGNPAVARAAATHLVETVGVPATIGPLFSEPFIDVVSSVTNPNDVLAFQPTGTSPQVNGLFLPKKLVWRNIASDVYQGVAAAKWIQDTGLTKILVLYKEDLYGNDLQFEVAKVLDADENLEVKYVGYTNPVLAADPSPSGLAQEYGAEVLGAMRPDGGPEFTPEVVYVIGTNEGAIVTSAYFSVALETLTLPAPAQVLLSHGAVPAMGELAQGLEDSGLAQLTAFVNGVAPDIFDPDSTTYRSYSVKYRATFEDAQPALASTTSFDGIISIFLAMSGVPDGDPLTGANVSAQFPRLSDPAAMDITFFETNYIGTARGRMAAGENIDLVGISSSLDYDQDTGDVYTRFIHWKPTKIQATGVWSIEQVATFPFPNAPATDGGAWTPTE